MDLKAINKAKRRLETAKRAVSRLEVSKTYGEFTGSWYEFLTSAKTVYTVLEQGAKSSPQSRQWFGAKKQFRKNDPLLQYIFQARNDEEHGLGSSVGLSPEKLEIGVSGPNKSNSIRLDGGPFHNVIATGCKTAFVFEGAAPPPGLRVTSLDKKPVMIRHTPSTTMLVEVTARCGEVYQPPELHLGKYIDNASPLNIAKLMLLYLEFLLKEASCLN